MIEIKDLAWDVIMAERNRRDKTPNWDLIDKTTNVLRELKKPKRKYYDKDCEVLLIWQLKKKSQ